MVRGGPIRRQVRSLAERVRGGERLALRCHCAPDACHVDVIVQLVLAQVDLDGQKEN